MFSRSTSFNSRDGETGIRDIYVTSFFPILHFEDLRRMIDRHLSASHASASPTREEKGRVSSAVNRLLWAGDDDWVETSVSLFTVDKEMVFSLVGEVRKLVGLKWETERFGRLGLDLDVFAAGIWGLIEDVLTPDFLFCRALVLQWRGYWFSWWWWWWWRKTKPVCGGELV